MWMASDRTDNFAEKMEQREGRRGAMRGEKEGREKKMIRRKQ